MHSDSLDYYRLLNISRDAAPDDIKKAFRSLAHRFHPDKNPGDKEAEDVFKKINTAYEILSDPHKRMMYDTTGYADPDKINPAPCYGSGCGRKRGFGCERFRGKGMWNFLNENAEIYDVFITGDEAQAGAEISFSYKNNSIENSLRIKLPQNLQDGTVLQCINSETGNIFL